MKNYLLIVFVCIIYCNDTHLHAQQTDTYVPPGGARLMARIEEGDTVLLAFLRDIYVFPKNRFKNKSQERYFWRTVRDVKRALPYAKMVSQEMNLVNQQLAKIPTEAGRKKFLAKYEKIVFQKHEASLRKLTISQGRILIKLIDRETNSSSYDLIKSYRGGFSAFFWQGVARLFGSDLKEEYDGADKDKIVERIIILVEAGQL
jgi:hypothetical protein